MDAIKTNVPTSPTLDTVANSLTDLKALLVDFFSRLQPLFSSDTSVEVHFDLTNYIDPTELRPQEHSINLTLIERMARFETMFHVPTMLSLAADMTLPWPKPGKLSVTFGMVSAICRTMEPDEAEQAMRPEGRPPFVEAPYFEWELKPTSDIVNYRGFFPFFKGYVEEV